MAELFILSKTKHKEMSLRFIICSYFFYPFMLSPCLLQEAAQWKTNCATSTIINLFEGVFSVSSLFILLSFIGS